MGALTGFSCATCLECFFRVLCLDRFVWAVKEDLDFFEALILGEAVFFCPASLETTGVFFLIADFEGAPNTCHGNNSSSAMVIKSVPLFIIIVRFPLFEWLC